MNFLTRLFCRHELQFFRNLHGDEVNTWGGKRSLWTCSKCDSVIAKREPHPTK